MGYYLLFLGGQYSLANFVWETLFMGGTIHSYTGVIKFWGEYSATWQ